MGKMPHSCPFAALTAVMGALECRTMQQMWTKADDDIGRLAHEQTAC